MANSGHGAFFLSCILSRVLVRLSLIPALSRNRRALAGYARRMERSRRYIFLQAQS